MQLFPPLPHGTPVERVRTVGSDGLRVFGLPAIFRGFRATSDPDLHRALWSAYMTEEGRPWAYSSL